MDTIILGAIGSVASLLIGGIILHRFALRRERRKEFNEAVDAVSLSLQHLGRGPSDVEVINFLRRAGPIGRWRFNRALAEYRAALADGIKQDPETGSISYPDDKRIRRAMAALKKCCRRK